MKDNPNAQRVVEALEAARLRIYSKLPYFSHMASITVWVPSQGLKTMSTDMFGRVYFDPDLDWGQETIAAVYFHELLHVLLGHNKRFAQLPKDRQHPVVWNYAGDMEINQVVLASGFVFEETIPLLPQWFGFPEGETAEVYYALLLAQMKTEDPDADLCTQGLPKAVSQANDGQRQDKSAGKRQHNASGADGSIVIGSSVDGQLKPWEVAQNQQEQAERNATQAAQQEQWRKASEALKAQKAAIKARLANCTALEKEALQNELETLDAKLAEYASAFERLNREVTEVRQSLVEYAIDKTFAAIKNARDQGKLRQSIGSSAGRTILDQWIDYYTSVIQRKSLEPNKEFNMGETLQAVIDIHAATFASVTQSPLHIDAMMSQLFERDLISMSIEPSAFKVGFVFDTSGSMGADEHAQSLAAAKEIYKQYKALNEAIEIYAYACDVEATSGIPIYGIGQLQRLQLVGGGGTAMDAGIKKACDEGCSIIWVFTDGATPWEASDVIISLVITGSFAGSEDAKEEEQQALKAMIEAARGSGKVAHVLLADAIAAQ